MERWFCRVELSRCTLPTDCKSLRKTEIPGIIGNIIQSRKRDTDVQDRLLDSVEGGEGGMFRENSIETCILSRVKQITSPDWMHETSARAWCTGKTQRDRMEREVGGRSGWGTHVKPWLIHVNLWQKPLQYCKVISLQLIKINGKKIDKTLQWVWEP